jgi:hypothetical protein
VTSPAASEGVDRGCGRATDPGVVAGVSDDAGDGDRGTDWVDSLNSGTVVAGGGTAADVSAIDPASRTAYAAGEIAQCDLRFGPFPIL